MKRGNIGSDAKSVLVFCPAGILMAIFKSVNSAGESLGIHPQAISNASVGRTVSSSGLYFRHLDNDVVIESCDLGVLNVKDYDTEVGEIKAYKPKSVLYKERNSFFNRKNKKEYESKSDQ